MLHLGDDLVLYSVPFVLLLLVTRSPLWSAALVAVLYLCVLLLRFPQVPSSRARRVLHPAGRTVGSGGVSVVAHRGGGHDAPENTLAAIREVRVRFSPRPSAKAQSVNAWFGLGSSSHDLEVTSLPY